MFKNTGGPPAFDSVVAMEGKFTYRPELDQEPNVEVLMVFMSSETHRTYGSCPTRANMWSKETMEAFRAFLDSAESDFGKVLFGTGILSQDLHTPNTGGAETERGLPETLPTKLPKGLGE